MTRGRASRRSGRSDRGSGHGGSRWYGGGASRWGGLWGGQWHGGGGGAIFIVVVGVVLVVVSVLCRDPEDRWLQRQTHTTLATHGVEGHGRARG